MAKHLTCENTMCVFHEDKNLCIKDSIEIGYSGCKSFKPDVPYYTNIVWTLLDENNFIPTFGIEWTDEKRIAFYIVAQIWQLKIANDPIRGMIYFCTETSGALNREHIVELKINEDELQRFHKLCVEDDIMSLLPNGYEDEEYLKSNQPYGFLSPQGKFYPGDWGTHEQLAFDIIEENDLGGEFGAAEHSQCSGLARDFLIQVKGYALIHDPQQLSYIVTHIKKLTKRQREFLYDYFNEMGMKERAKTYLED